MNTHYLIVAEISSIKLGFFIFVGLIVLFWTAFTHMYGSLWLQSRLSGVPISFAELVGMTLRKSDAKTIVTCGITAAKAGIMLSWAELEAHYLAGGCVTDIVRAMIILEQAEINPGWETLAKEDLLGRDVLGEAELTAEKIITNRSMLETNQEYVEDKTFETKYE